MVECTTCAIDYILEDGSCVPKIENIFYNNNIAQEDPEEVICSEFKNGNDPFNCVQASLQCRELQCLYCELENRERCLECEKSYIRMEGKCFQESEFNVIEDTPLLES